MTLGGAVLKALPEPGFLPGVREKGDCAANC